MPEEEFFFHHNENLEKHRNICSRCSGNEAPYGNDLASEQLQLRLVSPTNSVKVFPNEAIDFEVILEDFFGEQMAGVEVAGKPITVQASSNCFLNSDARRPVTLDGNVVGVIQVVGGSGDTCVITFSESSFQTSLSVEIKKCPKYTLPFAGNAQFEVCIDEKIINHESAFEAVQIVFGVISGILLVILVALSVIAVIKFKVSYIPIAIYFFGGLKLFISVFLMIPDPTDDICNAILWILGVGSAMIYGCLVGALLRSLLNQSIVLIPIVTAVCVLLELIVLIVWTTVDAVGEDFYQDEVDIVLYCNSTDSAFYIAEIVIIGVALLFALVLTGFASVGKDKYERTYVTCSTIYVITLIVAVLIPLLLVLDLDELYARYVLTVICLCMVAIAPLSIIFIIHVLETFNKTFTITGCAGDSMASSTFSYEYSSTED